PADTGVRVVGILALPNGASVAILYHVVAVRVDHRHDPDILIIYEPVGVGIVGITVEQPLDVAHRDLGHRDLARVDGSIIPVDRLGAGDGLVGDMQRIQVIAVPRQARVGERAGRMLLAPGVAYINLLSQSRIGCYV